MWNFIEQNWNSQNKGAIRNENNLDLDKSPLFVSIWNCTAKSQWLGSSNSSTQMHAGNMKKTVLRIGANFATSFEVLYVFLTNFNWIDFFSSPCWFSYVHLPATWARKAINYVFDSIFTAFFALHHYYWLLHNYLLLNNRKGINQNQMITLQVGSCKKYWCAHGSKW